MSGIEISHFFSMRVSDALDRFYCFFFKRERSWALQSYCWIGLKDKVLLKDEKI